MMDKDNLITIILPIDVTGSEGTTIRFVPYRQYYCKEKIMMSFNREEDCGNNYSRKKIPAYIIELMDQEFIISSRNAMPAEFVRQGNELLTNQEAARQYLLIDSKVKDYKKETLEVIGHDVKAAERTDYNGGWLLRELSKRDNQE